MSENGNGNKNFEFIKEQVVEKKRKKIKRVLIPVITTVFLAILFGLIAAVTFVIAEPRLNEFLSKDEEDKTQVSFPTEYPVQTKDSQAQNITPANGNPEEDTKAEQEDSKTEEKDPVVVEKSIDADINDFISINDKIRTVAYETEKSLVNISSIISGTDIFKNKIDRTVKTTGLIIAECGEDLLILVSMDRVKDASSIKVVFSEAFLVDATLQSYENDLNLAVLSLPLENIPEIYKNSYTICNFGESYSVSVGSPILALGSPNGHPKSMEQGIVTSRGSIISLTDNQLDLFNTNIATNENSDGIIVNMRGEIIGIITRTLKEDINKELSTVIGISRLRIIIERLANKKPIIYFGIKADDMTEAAKLEHSVSNGIYVNEIQTNSPAFDAGLKNGDIILQVNEQSILNTNNFYNAISNYQPEDTVVVKIKRTSGSTEKELDLTVTLTEKMK